MTDAHIYVIGILLAWMAGIRAYLTVFGVGLAGLLGWVDLPPALEPTTSWWVLGTCGLLAVAEFFADKIPGVDSAWDLLPEMTDPRHPRLPLVPPPASLPRRRFVQGLAFAGLAGGSGLLRLPAAAYSSAATLLRPTMPNLLAT